MKDVHSPLTKQEMNTLYLNKEGNMENSNTIKRASALGVICYGLGDLASQFIWTFVGSYLTIFYTDIVGFAPIIVSGIMLLVRVWDAINDPMMGSIAENTRSKFGRFRPYIAFGSPFLAVFAVLTFVNMGNGTGGVIFSTVIYIIAGMLYTLVNIPYSSLAAVMTEDPKQRKLIGTSRSVGMNIGMIIVNSCSAGLALHFSGNGAEVATGHGYMMTAIVYYDALSDRYEEAQCNMTEETVKIKIHLLPGESCLLVEKTAGVDAQRVYTDICERIAGCSEYIDLAKDWEVSCEKAGKGTERGEWKLMKELALISDEDPVFSGTIHYKKKLQIGKKPVEAYLAAEQVYEVMRVRVNGKEAGTVLTPPYQVPIGQLLEAGDNIIEIEVATTPARDAASYPQPPFDFFHEALEPTGICGSVGIYFKY